MPYYIYYYIYYNAIAVKVATTVRETYTDLQKVFPKYLRDELVIGYKKNINACTHARTHARTHAHVYIKAVKSHETSTLNV